MVIKSSASMIGTVQTIFTMLDLISLKAAYRQALIPHKSVSWTSKWECKEDLLIRK